MTRTGIKLDLDVGDLVASAGRARGAIASIEEAMKKAQDEKRFDDYGKLAYQKERLQGGTAGFEKNIHALANNQKFQGVGENGQQVFRFDPETHSLFKKQTDAIKQLTEQYEAAIQRGDMEAARALTPQIEQRQNEFRKLTEQANAPAGARGGVAGAVNAIGFHQIAGAINEGFSRWAGSINRSGIVNQYGSGDILGGRISEQRRVANLRGGIAQAGLGLVGTVAGAFLGPAGAMALGSIGSNLGQAISTWLGVPIDREETRAAYAGLWNQRSDSAMELAALRGTPNQVRDAFSMASRAAAEFGFSAEEGMDAMKQAARQGLDGSVVRQILQHERGTGADHGTMMSLATLSERFGGGDALRAGWDGLQASGMQTGQQTEFLRAMQRVMEDGISRGFVRSSDQVARNLTMLSKMTNNNPLWQGERGAQRLMDMNAGLEGATALQDSTQILLFRAAMDIARKTNPYATYVDGMKILEDPGRYFPYLFDKAMELFRQAEGGNKEGIIERIRQAFGFNYTKAYEIFRSGRMTDAQELLAKGRVASIPEASSPELNAARATQEIVYRMVQKGQEYWDDKLPKIYERLDAIKEELARRRDAPAPVTDTSGMTPAEVLYVKQRKYREALERGCLDSITEAARNLYLARMEVLHINPADDPIFNLEQFEVRKTMAMSGLFSGRAGRVAQNSINDMLRSAKFSGDEIQRQKANEVVEIFESIQSLPRNDRRDMVRNNTLNPLANTTDIKQLLRELRELKRNDSNSPYDFRRTPGEYEELIALGNDHRRDLYNFAERRLPAAMEGLFSPGLRITASGRADGDAKDQIKRTINEAAISEDDGQHRMAMEAYEIFKSLPQNIRGEMNRSNTVNSLANANNIEQLLRELIELTRDLEVTINVP